MDSQNVHIILLYFPGWTQLRVNVLQIPHLIVLKVHKFDQVVRQVEEMNEIVERDLTELLKQYKALQAADHGYFERYFD